jgi:hypothetical protein
MLGAHLGSTGCGDNFGLISAGLCGYEIRNPAFSVETICAPGVIAREPQFRSVPSEQGIALKKLMPPDKVAGAYKLDVRKMVGC